MVACHKKGLIPAKHLCLSRFQIYFCSGCQCQDNEYECDDGGCINIEQRCNEVRDCKDNSDEDDCRTLDFDVEQYHKDKPPLPFTGMGVAGTKYGLSRRTSVKVDVVVMSLNTFQELEMTFKATVKLVMTWRDNRLNFRNIKFGGISGNGLGREESGQVGAFW